MREIERLIEETKEWRLWHREQQNFIEAAACAIRDFRATADNLRKALTS